nr:hypothetical protein [Effusibacillus pohliae]
MTFTPYSSAQGGRTITRHEWQISGPTGTTTYSSPPNQVFNRPGSYTVQYRVQDSGGYWSSWYSQTLNVYGKPTASFTVTPNPVYTGDTVTYQTNDSTPNPGQWINQRQWQISGPTGTWTQWWSAPSSFSTPGVYTISERVADTTGTWSDWTSQTLVVKAPIPPTASFTVNPNPATTADTLSVNLSEYDPQGYPIVYRQWWISGPYGSWYQSYAPTNFAYEGTYTIRLRIQDSRGLWSDWYTQTVRVTEAPVASFTLSPNPAMTYDTISYSDSSYGRTYPIVERQWTISGPNGTVTQSTPPSNFPKAGTYTITERVKNSIGNWSVPYSHADDDRTLVDASVAAGARGIIHAGTGNGSVHDNTLPRLQDAVKKGVVVVRDTRVPEGMVTHEALTTKITLFLQTTSTRKRLVFC